MRTRRQQKIRDALESIMLEPGDDNLAVALCTYFSDHPDRPEDDDEETDENWTVWVADCEDETLDRMVAAVEKVFEDERIARIKDAFDRLQAEIERSIAS